MRALALSILLLTTSLTAQASFWRECAPRYRALVTEKVSGRPFRLAISDRVQLFDRKTPMLATYLGRRMVDGKPYLLFHVGDRYRVRWIPEASLIVDNPGPGGYQELPVIEVQQGPTCFVHSSRNALSVLNQLGLLPESELKFLLEHQPDVLFSELKKEVSAEAYDAAYHAFKAPEKVRSLFERGLPASEWEKRFREMGYTQADKRQQVFGKHGLKVTITWSAEELRAHLRQGLPAFLDIPISYSRRIVSYEGAPGQVTTSANAFYPASARDPRYFGWHSVMALGIVEGDGPTAGKVLVLDSAFGSDVQLWDIDDIAKAIDRSHTMAVSLVEPAR